MVERELEAPIYGTKDVLFWRLCEWEQNAAKKKEGGIFGEQEERVGIGDRAGDPKDPP